MEIISTTVYENLTLCKLQKAYPLFFKWLPVLQVIPRFCLKHT